VQLLHWLKQVWNTWKRFGHWLGNLVGAVVLTLLYFTIVLPYGVAIRFFSDPLALKAVKAGSFWRPRPQAAPSLEEAQTQ
jgi:hypothetical protein